MACIVVGEMPAHIKYPVINGLKECGQCHAIKPVSEFLKARTHYAAQCLVCRKAYLFSYRRRPEVKQRSQQYVKAYRAIAKNRDRINQYTSQWRKKLPQQRKDRRNEKRRIWAAHQKQLAVTYKGGKCECCGYSGCLAAMDFHHRNPLEKEGYGTGALRSHRTFEQNKPEIDKCVLVCVRCHREIHAGIRSV